jgi:hypothetical protein
MSSFQSSTSELRTSESSTSENTFEFGSKRNNAICGKNFKFSFQKMRTSINYELNPMYQQPLTKPHKNYVYNVIQERKSQTLYDIWVGLGWRSNEKSRATFEIHSSVGVEIGRLINFHLPKRDFQKVNMTIQGQSMSVRIYHWYEVPFIVSLIFTYFDLFQYIPNHWKYAFFINTHLHSILHNLSRISSNIADKISQIMNNPILTQKMQNMILREFTDSNVIDKNNTYKYYHNIPLYCINAKYGIAIELFIIQNINEVFT